MVLHHGSTSAHISTSFTTDPLRTSQPLPKFAPIVLICQLGAHGATRAYWARIGCEWVVPGHGRAGGAEKGPLSLETPVEQTDQGGIGSGVGPDHEASNSRSDSAQLDGRGPMTARHVVEVTFSEGGTDLVDALKVPGQPEGGAQLIGAAFVATLYGAQAVHQMPVRHGGG